MKDFELGLKIASLADIEAGELLIEGQRYKLAGWGGSGVELCTFLQGLDRYHDLDIFVIEPVEEL